MVLKLNKVQFLLPLDFCSYEGANIRRQLISELIEGIISSVSVMLRPLLIRITQHETEQITEQYFEKSNKFLEGYDELKEDSQAISQPSVSPQKNFEVGDSDNSFSYLLHQKGTNKESESQDFRKTEVHPGSRWDPTTSKSDNHLDFVWRRKKTKKSIKIHQLNFLFSVISFPQFQATFIQRLLILFL